MIVAAVCRPENMDSKKLPGIRVRVEKLVVYMIPPTFNWIIPLLQAILLLVVRSSLPSKLFLTTAAEEEAHCGEVTVKESSTSEAILPVASMGENNGGDDDDDGEELLFLEGMLL